MQNKDNIYIKILILIYQHALRGKIKHLYYSRSSCFFNLLSMSAQLSKKQFEISLILVDLFVNYFDNGFIIVTSPGKHNPK